MFLGLFESNPSAAVAFLLGLVIGITVHEASHATSAYLLGDDTAYRDGRVTLNPLSHLDLLGSMMLLLAGFGWGRPTPVVPSKLRGGVFGAVAVALAGPISNLLIVVLCAALYLLPPFRDPGGYLFVLVVMVAFTNALLHDAGHVSDRFGLSAEEQLDVGRAALEEILQAEGAV